MNNQEKRSTPTVMDIIKRRAFEYLNSGDYKGAVTSFLSDIHKLPGITDEKVKDRVLLGMFFINDQKNLNEAAVRNFINGFSDPER